jgi:hypothetical protein
MLLLVILTAAQAATASGAIAVPAVKIDHSTLIERYCSGASPAKPDPAVSAELDARVSEFQAAWDKDGPALLAEDVRLTGQPFRFHETIAALSACPDLPSMSLPLTINAVRFTNAYLSSPSLPPQPVGLGRVGPPPGPRKVIPLSGFAPVLWHEVTHRFVHDIISAKPGHTTPLLQKYSAENQITRSHLHLFALNQLIWRKLGRESEFDAQEQSLKSRGIQAYVRAIAIVRAEGAEKFVAELAR